MTWTRRDWMIVLAVTLLAAGLRFYQLGVVPPGFQFDEAFNAIDAGQIIDGNRPLFLPANAGREVLYSYFQAGLGALFGLNIYTLRLASALAGIAAIPAAYVLLRMLLRHQSRKIAALTSLTLAISLWHIHFSHYGIRVILMPPLLSAIFGLYWFGLRETQGAGSHSGHLSSGVYPFVAFISSGLLTGLSVWTHPTGRFVPFVLMLYTGWVWWHYPERRRWSWRHPLVGLILTGLVAFLAFLPLGLQFYHHPDWFTGHASEVSVFAARVGGDAPWRMLLANVGHVLGMFSLQGDQEWAHNLAGRPVFDPLLSLPFLIGLVLWGKRLWQRRPTDPDVDALCLLALWVFVMLAPSVFSEAAPNFSRTLPSLPALFVAAGLGLTWLTERFSRSVAGWPISVGAALASLILLVSGVWASYDYFVRFPQRPEVYYLYDADKLDALHYLNQLAAQRKVYFDRLWAEHPPVAFLSSSKYIKSLDMGDTLVLPPVGQAAVYAFPAEKAKEAARLAKFWPGLQPETTLNRFNSPLLSVVNVAAERLTDWPTVFQPTTVLDARFEDAPTLLGMQTTPGSSTITLFWRAEAQTRRSLTAFIHLLDADNQRVGQIDKLPGNGSYVTPEWSPGERVIDRYDPTITDPCASGEEVRVQVGWYELGDNGARRPRLGVAGDTALAGRLTLPVIAYPAAQVALPNPRHLPLTAQLTLVAAIVHETDWQAGAPLTVDLYWRGKQAAATIPLRLQIANAQATKPLWTGTLAPGTTWPDDAIVCRRLRVRLPSTLTPGPYQLQVATNEQSLTFSDLTLKPSTRQFIVPPVAHAITATFGEEIRLLGYTITPPDGQAALTVTLVWQAQTVPQASYTVFVHLLNEQGQIVAQSDAIPGAGYATDHWVTGEAVTDPHTLALPAALPAGAYRLAVGLYDAVSGQRLPVVDAAGQPFADGVVQLGKVQR